MKVNLPVTEISLLCFLFLLASPLAAFENKTAQLEGLEVTMSLVKRTPIAQDKPWPSESIVLGSDSFTVAGKTIQELLRTNHIAPDVEAFTVVYQLNPSVTTLSDLNLSQIRLPIVRGGPELVTLFGAGYIVALTVDSTTKAAFSQNVERLNGFVQDSSRLSAARFEDPSKASAAVVSLRLISDRLNRINERVVQRYGRAIPSEVLRQLNGDARHLGDVLVSQQQIGPDGYAFIEAVRKDVEVKAQPFVEAAAGEAPSRWPEVSVKVTTVRGNHEISGLRILYVPEALSRYRDEFRSFGALTSPTKQVLPEADYCFWAIHDLDKNEKPISKTLCREIRKEQDNEVQLTVRQ
jgi:hypothetical protein